MMNARKLTFNDTRSKISSSNTKSEKLIVISFLHILGGPEKAAGHHNGRSM
jgi:hypothetical protein